MKNTPLAWHAPELAVRWMEPGACRIWRSKGLYLSYLDSCFGIAQDRQALERIGHDLRTGRLRCGIAKERGQSDHANYNLSLRQRQDAGLLAKLTWGFRMGDVVQFVPRKKTASSNPPSRLTLSEILVEESVRPRIEAVITAYPKAVIEAVARPSGNLDLTVGDQVVASISAGSWIGRPNSTAAIGDLAKSSGKIVVADRDSLNVLVGNAADPWSMADVTAAWLASGDAFAAFSYRDGALVGIATAADEETLLCDMVPTLAAEFAGEANVKLITHVSDSTLATLVRAAAVKALGEIRVCEELPA